MMMRIVAAAAAVVVSAACATPPSAPTVPETPVNPQSNSFEGIWTLNYRVEDCSGFRQCIHFRGDTRTIYLHLARSAGGYEGVVDLEPHVSVSGMVSPDGTLTLTGRRAAAHADDFDVEIDAITLENAGWSQSNPTGSVRFMTKGPSSSNFMGTAITHGPITAVERAGSLDSMPVFPGTWTGSVAIRTCDATGWTHCYPLWNDTTYPVTLNLVPGAGGVEGTLKLGGSTIPVSGAITGNGVRLSGTASKSTGK